MAAAWVHPLRVLRSRLAHAALAATLGCLAVPAAAQDMAFFPMGWDFGAVPVGHTASQTFRLVSTGLSPVWAYFVALNGVPAETPTMVSPQFDPPGYAFGPFSFNPNPAYWAAHPMPLELAPGDELDIEIRFTPTEPGSFLAYFEVVSNDAGIPPQDLMFLPLRGTGVDAVVPEPGVLALVALGLAGAASSRRGRARTGFPA